MAISTSEGVIHMLTFYELRSRIFHSICIGIGFVFMPWIAAGQEPVDPSIVKTAATSDANNSIEKQFSDCENRLTFEQKAVFFQLGTEERTKWLTENCPYQKPQEELSRSVVPSDIDPPSDRRSVRIVTEDETVLEGRIDTVHQYSVSIYAQRRPGTLVTADIDGHAVSGVVNDWQPNLGTA